MDNLTIIPYNNENHFEMITEWAKQRKMVFLPILLSKQGFIVTDNNEPVLAVWIYTILGVPIIQLDNLITKPRTNPVKVRKYWALMLEFIKNYISQLEQLSGNKIFMIRCFINKRLATEAEKSGFLVDMTEGTICRLILG